MLRRHHQGPRRGLSVYEIAFFTTLFSLVPAILTTPKGENWLTFWQVKHPRLVHLRGLSGVIGNLCIIYAFVTIPLAEAYSIAFLAPIFIVAISVVVLKETVSLQRWLFLGASFVGVLLVVRPGFRDLHPGTFAAVVAAVAGAVTTTVLAARVARGKARQPDRHGVALHPRGQRHTDDRDRQLPAAHLAGAAPGC